VLRDAVPRLPPGAGDISAGIMCQEGQRLLNRLAQLAKGHRNSMKSQIAAYVTAGQTPSVAITGSELAGTVRL